MNRLTKPAIAMVAMLALAGGGIGIVSAQTSDGATPTATEEPAATDVAQPTETDEQDATPEPADDAAKDADTSTDDSDTTDGTDDSGGRICDHDRGADATDDSATPSTSGSSLTF